MLNNRAAPDLDLPARFFVTGLAGLLLVALSSPWLLPSLAESFYTPRVLGFVHANTLGVIAMIVMGASYQFVPVVLQTPLASIAAGRLSHWTLVAGIVTFLIGLFWPSPVATALGGSLLVVAIGLYVGNVAVTFTRAPQRDVSAWHVAVATVGLLSAALLGLLLAANKVAGVLGPSTFVTLAAHVTLMLGGWIAVLFQGVAYRLVGMFTLSEEYLWTPGAWLSLCLTAGGAWLVAGGLYGLGPAVALAGALALFGGIAAFAVQLARLYRLRRRRTFDVHIPFALTSVAFALIAAAMLVAGLALGIGAGDRWWTLAGWLAIAGFAETAIQGFLFKISTFLVWLHRYAPIAGRQRVPTLEQLYGRRVAVIGWLLWTSGVAAVGGVLASGLDRLMVPAGVLWAAGAACFATNMIRVGLHWRGAPRGVPVSASRAAQARTQGGYAADCETPGRTQYKQ